MTTGSIVVDNRVWVQDSDGLWHRVGFNSSKSWSGTDKVKQPRVKKFSDFQTEWRFLGSKSGKWLPARYVWVMVSGEKKRILQKPKWVPTRDGTWIPRLRYKPQPGISKTRKIRPPEHAYQMTYQQSWNRLYTGSTYRWNFYPYIWTDFKYTQEERFSGVGYVDTWTANDNLALLGRLRTKVAGSDFNFGVFLAEGAQATRMIADAAIRIERSMRYLKKGNFLRAARALSDSAIVPKGMKRGRSLASNWLELQYGWLPLLKDAEAGAQFLAHLETAPCQQSVRVRIKKDFLSTRQKDPHPQYEDVGTKITRSRQIKAVFSDISVVGLAGLADPLSVAWEKLPWSFVADWFIPIQSYLSARGLANSLTGQFVTTDVIRITWQGCQTTSFYTAPDRLKLETPADNYKVVQLTRTVDDTLIVPLPRVKTLGEAASWRHAANAVALLTQRFRS